MIKGGKLMKKLLIAAATLTLAFSTIPNLTSEAKAAPTRSAYCDMAKSQRNPVSWNAYYNCVEKPVAAAPVVERKRVRNSGNPYCGMAKSQRNPVSWNAYYRCLSSR
jgi:hypothetical protein